MRGREREEEGEEGRERALLTGYRVERGGEWAFGALFPCIGIGLRKEREVDDDFT